ncbi:MAG: VanZ family protein [Chitinophagaceae bacterium]
MSDINAPLRGQMRRFIPGIAWFFIILVLICLPGEDLPKIDNWFTLIYGDKLIHIGIFALLAYLFMQPLSKTALKGYELRNFFIKIALAVAIWGLATEFIQKYFVPGRSFDLLDFAADSIGAFLALWVSAKQFLK